MSFQPAIPRFGTFFFESRFEDARQLGDGGVGSLPPWHDPSTVWTEPKNGERGLCDHLSWGGFFISSTPVDQEGPASVSRDQYQE